MNPKTPANPKPVLSFGFFILLITLLAAMFPAGHRAEALGLLNRGEGSSQRGFLIFFPAILSSGIVSNPIPTATPPAPTATPAAPTPTPTEPAGPNSFFLPWDFQGAAQATDGPSLAVDANGGVHIVYTAYTSDASGNRPAYYVYCPGSCTSVSSFSDPVIFNGKIDHANLALDPQGRPRVMWIGIDPLQEKLMAYVYQSCDSGCTNAANWQTTRIAGLDNVLAHNSRFFAIDPHGHPGLIYYLGWSGSANGTYFAHCESGCTDPAGWQNTLVSPAELRFPILKFDRNGLPRIAGAYLDLSADPALDFLVYLECDAGCQNITQGGSFPVKTCTLCDLPAGYFDLAFDSSSRPRLLLFTGSLEAGRGYDANTLYYLYCNNNCGDWNTSDWNGYALGLAVGIGTYPQLAINSQNQPRVVYEEVSSGLVYAWCKSGCETANPSWENMLADSSAELDVNEPVPPIPPCQVAGWFTGKRASLSLDSAGNPRIAYDAEHWQGLDPVDYPPGSPGCPSFNLDQVNARFTLFNQP